MVRQDLDDLWRAVDVKALLDGLQLHVAHVWSADPGIGDSAPRDDLTVMGIDQERGPNDIPIPLGEFRPNQARS